MSRNGAIVLMIGLSVAPSAAQSKQTQEPARPAPTPEQLAIQAASEKDHQRVMDELGIKTLRAPVENNPNSTNYDESKANVYPNIPDPLLMSDGTRVTTATMWWTKRRPQILELYDREIYGRTPPNLPKVNWEVKSVVHEMNGGVPVITKTLVGHVDNSADRQITVDIELTLSTPADAKGPVPVIMELGWSKEFLAMLAKMYPQLAKPEPGPTWQQQVLRRGWGYAEYIPTSVQPDNGAGLTKGIIGLVNRGQPRTLDDWGSLKAWGWGASKALDYFESGKDVDAKQVGIAGHSRYGKAAIVAMAYDPRFAIGYISSSGEGGAKLYRHIFGEQVSNVAGAQEYHWMAGNFLKYAGPLTPGDLPVDNNELIALVAPRPVFISGGSITGGDGWIDPKGMFLAAVDAGPVYRLLGKKDLGTTAFPAMGTPLIDGDLAYREHAGGHTQGPNWPTFLEFASRYLHADAGVVHLTAEQDRERMLGLLGLKDSDMRPPPSGDAKAPNAANYDEAKADVYPKLPDPLVFDDGRPVTTVAEWKQRREEIKSDFDREILGRTPNHLPSVNWQVVKTARETYGGVDV
ncbi:MAG: hypothetical protein WBF42_19745, partial [Terracidiphilus sp.]